MNSHITDKFRKAFAEMPADVQKQARQAYRIFIENPHHPSLRFKSIHPTRSIYSVRIGTDKRNQRDAAYVAVWDKVKRVRSAAKGVYGDDSSEYEMVGGTRLSERKSKARKAAV